MPVNPSWIQFGQLPADQDPTSSQSPLSNVDYIRLSFADLNGLHLTKLIPVSMAGKIAKKACEIYSGVIQFGPRNEIILVPEVVDKKHINGFLSADWSTLHSVPWAGTIHEQLQKRIASVICEVHWPSGPVLNAMPRFVARSMVSRLRERHNLVVYSAFEPEYRIFNPDTISEDVLSQSKPQPGGPVPKTLTSGQDMYKTGLLSIYERFFLTLDHYLSGIGIQLQDFSNENGEGQIETPMLPEFGYKPADSYFIMKQAVREIAERHCNMYVSFMAKPLANTSSSGCHYNHSIWQADNPKKNAFYDPNEPNNLSRLALNWLGGLMAHLPAVIALCSPTVNCYRRLHRGLAPSLVNWDLHDRFVSVRVKNEDEPRTYIENRLPSSASCSYHVMAATLAAGMDGLERNLLPPEPGIKDEAKARKLPASLPEALEALKQDREFIAIIGEDFVDWYCQVKERGDLFKMPNAREMMLEEETEESLATERHEYFQYI